MRLSTILGSLFVAFAHEGRLYALQNIPQKMILIVTPGIFFVSNQKPNLPLQ